MTLDQKTLEKVKFWLEGPFDAETKKKVLELTQNPEALKDAFELDLLFGTGGVRSLMGVGPNRINHYTISWLTQAVANYLLKSPFPHKVLIGFDSRLNSEAFAKTAAGVLAANGINVILFTLLHPTPLISFGCREKKCSAALMITASHNPPTYNGYKVYWSDGSQVVAPHDVGITNELLHLDLSSIKSASLPHPLVTLEDTEIDHAYLRCLFFEQSLPEQNKEYGSLLKIIYSNIHGTGIYLVPKSLASWGFTNLEYVECQKPLDGNFPYAPNPNPEITETLSFGIVKLKSSHADLFIATDPDADRMAAVVLHEGAPYILSGNQIASLLLYFFCTESFKEKRKGVISTLVSTPLLEKIAKHFNLHYYGVLTGFKYIAEKIREWEKSEKETFLFGAEESCGYLKGDFVRDKDGIEASCLIAEMALHMKLQNKTLVDLLYTLYEKFGVHEEGQVSLTFKPGEEGMKQIEKIMKSLRINPLKIEGEKVVKVEDYLLGIKELPPSNVLAFYLEESFLIIRPSGTEPKLKIYGFTVSSEPHILSQIQHCKEKLSSLLQKAFSALQILANE